MSQTAVVLRFAEARKKDRAGVCLAEPGMGTKPEIKIMGRPSTAGRVRVLFIAGVAMESHKSALRAPSGGSQADGLPPGSSKQARGAKIRLAFGPGRVRFSLMVLVYDLCL